MPVFKIVVSVDSPHGRIPLEVEVRAADIDEAKPFAKKAVERLGYENVELGFPKLPRPSRKKKL